MDKGHLHVSFDDGVSAPQLNKPDVTERKKSILVSTNTRLTEKKSQLLDDSLNSQNYDFPPESEESQPSPLLSGKRSTTVPPKSDHDIKSRIPVPFTDDKENGEKSNTKTQVPLEAAVKGLIWQPKQTYDSKVPRFNPKATNSTTTDSKPSEPLVPVIDVKNDNKRKEGDMVNEKKNTETTESRHNSQPQEVIIEKNELNGNSESIPMTDLKESPFNRRKHSPKHSKIKDKTNIGGDSPTTAQKDKTVKKVPSREKIKDLNSNELEKGKVSEKDVIKTTAKDNLKDKELEKNLQETAIITQKESQASAKETVKSKLLLKGNNQTDVKEQKNTTVESKNEKNKSDSNSTIKVSTRSATPSPPSKDSKEKITEEKSSKEKLNVPPTPNQSKNNLQNAPSAPSTPRKEKRINRDKMRNAVKASRDSSPARSPVRSPARRKPDLKTIKAESNIRPDTVVNIEKHAEPVTARDVKVESNEMNQVTNKEDEEAKESADKILNELGDKPKSILTRVAMKKIASRAAKSGQVPQSDDVKHTNLSDSLNQSKSSGKFALSVPTTGKKDGDEKEDKTSLSSRRDSKFSVDTSSRKSVDIRLQNQVILGNKPIEEKQKSPLANTDSWIRSAIPHLPLSVAVLCLLLNIVIPGSGTILSGFAILCCGRARVNSKDDTVISTLCLNVWVGFAQLFTITFLLVGWFWSLAWGIRMVILAVEYRREQQLQREKQLQTMALSAFGSATHMRSLFP